MKKNGAISVEFICWLIGAIGVLAAYAHGTFITYREVAPRLDRIEAKLDCALGEKGACTRGGP